MTKKYSIFLFIILAVWGNSTTMNGQSAPKQYPHIHDIRCSTMEIDAISRERYPERGTLEEFERWLAPHVEDYKQHEANGFRATLLTIPVIFHIITDGAGAENLTAAQVQAQVDQLNIDFRNLAGSTHAVAADIEIEFCLATLDPSDNVLAEPGINRVTTYGDGAFTSAYVDNTIKPGTSWDPNSYMNIWSADISGGLLGWAQFPDNSGLAGMPASGGAANTDGVVALYSSIGSVANPNPGGGVYAQGRTMTHEVGHWVGLRHVWGDGGCGVDDFCSDTPESDAANYGCPNHTSCGTTDMVENYMDYSNDACMDIFTAEQKARVRTVMTLSPRRASLAASTKCGVAVPTIAFVSGGGTIINEQTDCSYQDVVLDVTISMAPSANATVNFNALGTASSAADYEVIPTSVVFPVGSTPTRQVTIRVYNDGIVEAAETILLSFSVTTTGDAIPATGDLLDHDVTINDDDLAPSGGGAVTILNQDFESGMAPFTTLGRVGSDRFQMGNTAAVNSAWWNLVATNTTQFAYTNDDVCNCNKDNDRLISPVFSLVGAYTTATLTFDHAFSAITGEVGEVQLSTGGAFTTISTLTNTSTVPPAVVVTPWITGATVDLTPYIGQATVQVRFRYNDGGQWLYGMAIDNVIITADAPANIQTADNTAVPKTISVGGMETVNYYDIASGDVMGTIQNLSAWDYQCTRMDVDRDAAAAAGPTAPFWDANPANALAAKTFFVSPDNNTPTGSYSITLYYTEAEIAAWEAATGKNRSVLKIVKVANTPISVVNAGNYGTYTIEQQPATIGAFGADVTLTATFNSGFSGFGIGDPGTPPAVLLPMDLLAFDAERLDKDVHLSWVTENEVNVDIYTLEKSTDGVTFQEINQQGAKGNGESLNSNTYSYLDTRVSAGTNYYRLGQVDVNRAQTYSRIIAVTIDEEEKPVMSFRPNPVYDNMAIDYTSPTDGEISIEIYDIVGHKMLEETNLAIDQGGNNILLNVKTYPSGMYILRVKQGSHASAKRFVKK